MRILSFCLLIMFFSCKTTYRKINVNSISENEKQKVYKFGLRVIETCKTNKFTPLNSDEASPGFTKLTLQLILDSCASLDKSNGAFKDMKLIEVIDDTFSKGQKIYRYKGNFERNDLLLEIRIWLGLDGKFRGIIWQEWKDIYVPYKNPKPNLQK